MDHFGSSVRKWLECCAGIAVDSPKKGGTGKGSEIALLSKADGKRISITGAFPEAQIDGFFKKLTAQKPCRRFFELMAFFKKLTAQKPCRQKMFQKLTQGPNYSLGPSNSCRESNALRRGHSTG